jgi:hypothetical protein
VRGSHAAWHVSTLASTPAELATETIRNPARHDLVLRVLAGIRRHPPSGRSAAATPCADLT